jgi:hypothetical protein
MTISFNYNKLPNKKGSDIKTPTIPVLLKGKSSFRMKVYALIDSGADVSVIPKGLAELLGIEMPKETTSSFGIGGEIKTKNSKMEVSIKKKHEEHTFTVPVQIILDDNAPIILGRAGFFNKFIISFDEENQKIRLKRKSKKYFQF